MTESVRCWIAPKVYIEVTPLPLEQQVIPPFVLEQSGKFIYSKFVIDENSPIIDPDDFIGMQIDLANQLIELANEKVKCKEWSSYKYFKKLETHPSEIFDTITCKILCCNQDTSAQEIIDFFNEM
jgi:hypothetical protein